MTKQEILEIQHKLIGEMALSVWDKTELIEDTKTLAYISGVNDAINELLRIVNPPENPTL